MPSWQQRVLRSEHGSRDAAACVQAGLREVPQEIGALFNDLLKLVASNGSAGSSAAAEPNAGAPLQSGGLPPQGAST